MKLLCELGPCCGQQRQHLPQRVQSPGQRKPQAGLSRVASPWPLGTAVCPLSGDLVSSRVSLTQLPWPRLLPGSRPCETVLFSSATLGLALTSQDLKGINPLAPRLRQDPKTPDRAGRKCFIIVCSPRLISNAKLKDGFLFKSGNLELCL